MSPLDIDTITRRRDATLNTFDHFAEWGERAALGLLASSFSGRLLRRIEVWKAASYHRHHLHGEFAIFDFDGILQGGWSTTERVVLIVACDLAGGTARLRSLDQLGVLDGHNHVAVLRALRDAHGIAQHHSTRDTLTAAFDDHLTVVRAAAAQEALA